MPVPQIAETIKPIKVAMLPRTVLICVKGQPELGLDISNRCDVVGGPVVIQVDADAVVFANDDAPLFAFQTPKGPYASLLWSRKAIRLGARVGTTCGYGRDERNKGEDRGNGQMHCWLECRFLSLLAKVGVNQEKSRKTRGRTRQDARRHELEFL